MKIKFLKEIIIANIILIFIPIISVISIINNDKYLNFDYRWITYVYSSIYEWILWAIINSYIWINWLIIDILVSFIINFLIIFFFTNLLFIKNKKIIYSLIFINSIFILISWHLFYFAIRWWV